MAHCISHLVVDANKQVLDSTQKSHFSIDSGQTEYLFNRLEIQSVTIISKLFYRLYSDGANSVSQCRVERPEEHCGISNKSIVYLI